MAAVALGFTSCKQEEDPKYHQPTDFKISTPALQNVEFETSADMTDASTFNLFATQPDYGYSAICNYSVLVSLDENCPEETAVSIENITPTSAAMTMKTFELGAAVCKLAKVTNEEAYAASDLAKGPVKVYFRGVCEIPGIEGSRIVSSNVVSYNKVVVPFTVKQAGWIYICGNVKSLDNGVDNNFTAPNAANLAVYDENFRLTEPEEMIGEKVYVGQFSLVSKGADLDASNPDNCSQFRFFTELLGWTNTASFGSNEADFYVLPVDYNKFATGFSGEGVWQGLGNWGVYVAQDTPFTVVADMVQYKVHFKEGLHDVTFVGRDPEFK